LPVRIQEKEIYSLITVHVSGYNPGKGTYLSPDFTD